jgi:hypothetical protein
MTRPAQAALVGAVLLHGAFGVPAPSDPGWPEAAVAILLFLAAGPALPAGLFGPGRPDWSRIGLLVLAYLAVVPALRGLAEGWAASDLLRDLIPAVFLFAPLAVVPLLARTDGADSLALALFAAGAAFTLRWWAGVAWEAPDFGAHALPEGPDHLLNAPAVLYTAAAAPLLAVRLWRTSRPGAILTIIGGLAALAALAGAVHRGALFLALAVLGYAGLRAMRRSPRAAVAAAAVILVSAPLWGPPVWNALALAAGKSQAVGLNARWEETAAALAQAARDPATLLFGDGWGALIANPAVGGWRVSYTHALFTYALIKTGLLGLAALSLWFGALAPVLARAWRRAPLDTAAALAPVLLAVTVHSAYKYLDTGLLLSLAAALANAPKNASRKGLPNLPACV